MGEFSDWKNPPYYIHVYTIVRPCVGRFFWRANFTVTLFLCATRSPSDPNHVVYVKLMTSENEKSHGSLILRIGAIFFGLGTLIYAGLEFLTFFEVGLKHEPIKVPFNEKARG